MEERSSTSFGFFESSSRSFFGQCASAKLGEELHGCRQVLGFRYSFGFFTLSRVVGAAHLLGLFAANSSILVSSFESRKPLVSEGSVLGLFAGGGAG